MKKESCFDLAELVLEHSRRILLHGLPSTGKSFLATRAGLRRGQNVYSVTLEEDQPSTDLLGSYVLRDKEMVWQDGVGIRAWREGARLVVNEIDHGSPECKSLLHALLDDPEFTQLTLPTGEVVRPAKGFQVIATMNGDPKDLDEALASRFPATIHIDQPNPQAIEALPKDLQGLARQTATHADENRRVALRLWYEFAWLRSKIGKDAAAQACFGAKAQDILDSLAIAAKATSKPTPAARKRKAGV